MTISKRYLAVLAVSVFALALSPIRSIAASITTVVFEGDSLVAQSRTTTWPETVQRSFPEIKTWVNVAIGGTTTTQILDRNANVAKHAPRNGGGVLFIDGGTNDIRYREGITPEGIYQNLKTLWANGRSQGFKVIAFTVHSSDIERPWPEGEILRRRLNDMIRSDPSLYDSLIEFDKLFPNVDNERLLVDHVHFAVEGNAKVAEAAIAALRKIQRSNDLLQVPQ